MTSPFRLRIRKSLADPVLQPALDGNAERRIRVRSEAMASLPEPEALRQQGHQMRAEVINHLEAYVDQFASRAQANGMIVHRCKTGAEAVQAVLEIIRASGGQRIAKAKTMLGEEIHLNPALEAAGLEVVETDLGEYIVQLRGEPPAHIITPAVHLTRTQVGELFHEELGIPLTEDIPTLTAAARAALRQVFLTADVGISGVNTGVAETGTVVLLTNEGNGRMVTTLPRVHIALMGIERLVPTMNDLATLMRLLPRSATGQKMTVYSSLLNGPRRAGDPDGPQERHLILVDNGRLAIKESPLREILYCIRCGACLNVCPVFRELGGHAYVGADGAHTPYPGPIGSVISPGLFGQANFGNLARASTLCGACKEVCPVDIDLPKLLLQVRAGGMHPTPAPDKNVPPVLNAGLRLFAWGASHPRIWRLVQRMLGAASRLYSPSREFMRLPAFTGWGYSKDFPRASLAPFVAQYRPQGPTSSVPLPGTPSVHPAVNVQTGQSKPQPVYGAGGVEQFIREASGVGVEIIATGASGLAEEVIAIARRKGVKEIFAWEAGLPAGVIAALAEDGVAVSYNPDPALKVGLTGAAAACAETGTILLPGGKGRPLTASLLPETHIVILHKDQILASLEDILQHHSLRTESALALITGPSRTADIEMTLTIGVHGPGEVCILLYE